MKDQVVIITGASSGIGLALVHEYARRGAKIVMAARSIDKMEETKSLLEQRSTEVLVVKTDVSKEEDCKNLVGRAID